MSHYRLAPFASVVPVLQEIDCILLETGADPFPVSYQEFTEVVDTDNLGIPIEAGFPIAHWHWDWLPQADIDALLAICSGSDAPVYVRTRKNEGLRYVFAIFQGTMLRPAIGDMILSDGGEPFFTQRRGSVDIDFINLVEIP